MDSIAVLIGSILGFTLKVSIVYFFGKKLIDYYFSIRSKSI